ncbi:hydrogenase small subunit [Methylococcales bacterium]|nr:hydrogenase small subunit [Methylococcales bacterium]
MSKQETILEHLQRQGISRRSFLKFCTLAASSMALPLSSVSAIADALGAALRPKVIWLSAQECTGCSETLLRAYDQYPIEKLLLEMISLDYHNTLMAPSGSAAENSRLESIKDGGHVVIIDGSIPLKQNGAWSAVGGRTILEVIQETVFNAGLILAVGNCAAFGGLPGAKPNPTDAHGVDDLINTLKKVSTSAPLINLPGCPPIPEVMTGVIVNFIISGGQAPQLDSLKRPLPYYQHVVHDSCSRLGQYQAGNFAKSFDDEGARQGYCLLDLGCKGTVTFNACTTQKWNTGLTEAPFNNPNSPQQATSFPMHSGHGCIGCSEPNFWDRAGGFYKPL